MRGWVRMKGMAVEGRAGVLGGGSSVRGPRGGARRRLDERVGLLWQAGHPGRLAGGYDSRGIERILR